MNRTRKILTAPGRGLKAFSQMVFRPSSWRMWRLPGSRFDYEREVGDGTNSSTVMAPLLWMQRNFPSAPLAMWKVDGSGQEEQVAKHDMLALLKRPNPYYSGRMLLTALVLDWIADGNGYWLKVRRKTGAPAELWWVPSFMIEPKGDEHTFITHYEYRPRGEAIRLESEDVIHVRYGLDPEDPRRGRSPLKSVLREVFTDDEAANFTASLLRNMGVPGLLVAPEGDNGPGVEDLEATKSKLSESFTGDKRGEPLVMSGPTKVQQFGFSPEQMDLKSLRRIPEERVSGVLGIPAIVAGLGAGLDRSTFANMAEAREMAYEENVVPGQDVIAEEIALQLLPDFEANPLDFRVGFDRSEVRVLQEDRNKLAERFDVGIRGGWIKVAEGRRAMDLEVEAEDEIFLRPIASIEVGEGAPEPEPEPAPEPIPPEEEPEVPAPPAKRRGVKDKHQPYQIKVREALDRMEEPLIAALTSELESDFADLGEQAAKRFEATVPEESLKASDEVLATQVTGGIDFGEWVDGKLKTRLETHYARTAKMTEETINTVLDLGTMLPDPVEKAIIHNGGTRRGLVDVTKQTHDAIARAIAQGREEGLGPKDIGRIIRDEVPKGRYVNAGSKYRAEMIARTETKYAQNVSSLGVYKAADTVKAVIAFDGDSDEICAARDGTTYSFSEADAELAGEHPNGTLSFAPVVGG